jgi:hypothetical protein
MVGFVKANPRWVNYSILRGIYGEIGKNRFIENPGPNVNMDIGPLRRRRSGITEIIVEFTMIIAILIAAVMIGGYSFGLISSYVPPAEVAVESASCFSSSNATVCQLTLANVGANDASTTGQCTISSASMKPCQVIGGGTIQAGGVLKGVECVIDGSTVQADSHVQGEISLSNGASVPFVGDVN